MQNGHSLRQCDFFIYADGARNTIPVRGITPPDFALVLSRWHPILLGFYQILSKRNAK